MRTVCEVRKKINRYLTNMNLTEGDIDLFVQPAWRLPRQRGGCQGYHVRKHALAQLAAVAGSNPIFLSHHRIF